MTNGGTLLNILRECWPSLLVILVVMFLFASYDRGMGSGWAGPRIVEIVAWLYRRARR